MTAPDAPQVEPLTLTLEEALRIALDADMRVTFDGTSVTIEDSFGDEIAYVEEWNWPKAFSEAFMEPVTPRDDPDILADCEERGWWVEGPFPPDRAALNGAKWRVYVTDGGWEGGATLGEAYAEARRLTDAHRRSVSAEKARRR